MTTGPPTARVLIHTGKGGVGKTSVAAATAVRLAQLGQRTLVLSTDPAHSLADVLDHPVGDAPTSVLPRLDAEQLVTQRRLRAGWAEIGDYLQQVLRWGGADGVEAAELAVLPGLDELFALLDLHEHATSGRYAVVVVDCAPTAETLRLLTLPDVLGWYLERVLPAQRRLTRVLRPTVARLSTVPVPSDGVFTALERLYARLLAARALLLDPAHASVRMVVTPDRVVLSEARRLLTSLGLFGHSVDAVVVNRVVPGSATEPFLTGWRARQQQLRAEIAATFGEIPRLHAALRTTEPVGAGALADLAADVFGARDPAAVLHDGPRPEIVERAGRRSLRLPLPEGVADDVELRQRGDELYVTVGAYTRSIVLPAALASAAATSAVVADGWLSIGFDDPVTAPRHGGPAGANAAVADR